MKKKNLFAVLFVLAAAVFTACGSDDSGSGSNNNGNNDDNPTVDDNTPSNPHLMEGEWKAETIYWVVGGNTQELPFTFLTNGCEVDYLTIKASAIAELKENKLVTTENGTNCEDVITNGTWTEQTVTISGVAREVISFDETTLQLKYYHPLVSQDITVEYSRQ